MSFLPDWMWAYNYPHNVIDSGSKIQGICTFTHCNALDVPVFPTPFYETCMMLLIFFVLWGIRKKIKTPGLMFMLFIALAGFERLFIEQIRINNEYNIFGFGITQAEIISSLMILLGIAGIILFYKKGNQINQWLNSRMKVPGTQTPK
jgi:phosphatidylglycerol:prolipoprotein diacylglycerol transferase